MAVKGLQSVEYCHLQYQTGHPSERGEQELKTFFRKSQLGLSVVMNFHNL
jgi:hypothetical protein